MQSVRCAATTAFLLSVAPVAAVARKSCASSLPGDLSYEACGGFCKEDKKVCLLPLRYHCADIPAQAQQRS